ncbi:hypothetical protein J3R82DRAFT_3203 [Butyriboletus roseoflavus]|nr:hypothetical protein J3R82DRAFT_3203 [Butyriboletus roseoflavus]
MERNTTSWLTESRSKSTRLGIIYVDRLANAPGSNPVQKHLNAFASTFPGDFKFPSTSPMRLHGILTHHSVEDRISQVKINLHKDMFQKQFDKLQSSFFQGRKLEWGVSYHHECFQQDKTDEAWNAVVKLFTTAPNRRDRQG